jgi:hypothetical protein
VATPVSEDVDLDALMMRVREAAMAGTASGGTIQTQVGEGAAPELDLIRVLEAQDQWNEQARQSFTALVDGIRALRDDWADAQTGLRREIRDLTALVEQLRSTPSPAGRPSAPAPTSSGRRRGAASPRGGGKGRPSGKRRPRS